MSSREKERKPGVVYTPALIAEMMADIAISKFPRKARSSDFKVLDPAVGEAALLMALSKKLGRRTKIRMVGLDLDAAVLKSIERNIPNLELHHLDFLALTESKRSLAVVGANFDLVLLNPPYVGEKGNRALFRRIRQTSLGRRFYQGKMDLSHFFIEQSLAMLKPNGILVAITPTYWLSATAGKKLRKEVFDKSCIIEVALLENQNVFPDAPGQHNMIVVFKRKAKPNVDLPCLVRRFKRSKLVEQFRVSQRELFLPDGTIALTSPKLRKELDRLEKNCPATLGEIASIDCGIQTGADKFTKAHAKAFPDIRAEIGEGIFVLSHREVEKLKLTMREKRIVKPFYKNSDIKIGGMCCRPTLNLLYLTKNTVLDRLPNIRKHLKRFKPILERRRECRSGKLPWYALHWARDPRVFLGMKIVTPQRAKRVKFHLSKDDFYASVDVYFIRPHKRQVNCERLVKALNSPESEKWLKSRGKLKGEYMELYCEPLSKLPLLLKD